MEGTEQQATALVGENASGQMEAAKAQAIGAHKLPALAEKVFRNHLNISSSHLAPYPTRPPVNRDQPLSTNIFFFAPVHKYVYNPSASPRGTRV